MSTMNEDQIKAALDAGIITPEQAGAMRGLNAQKATPLPNDDSVIGNEDNMRFVRSFSDVFIAIGIGLFALGLWGLGGMLGGESAIFSRRALWR